ncbi:hypothetical protein KCH_28870 [Kitasatospora cheerisanensis KCTC 2395]|uniref:Uncharacterized protein n=1 Tax=Kitasatospora cheerisanensis KCTC 2395 TaxID=1348663 RepID=A0A066Z4N2_9ACTN|nr:hypothetical protein KCH_28870 [Kitasatospora cheerisanensis KCTC 2395]
MGVAGLAEPGRSPGEQSNNPSGKVMAMSPRLREDARRSTRGVWTTSSAAEGRAGQSGRAES